jgi:hypothetical protein
VLDQPGDPQSMSDERSRAFDIEMQDWAECMPPEVWGNDCTTEQFVTIPIHREGRSLEAMLRYLLTNMAVTKPRKSRIGQAIQREREQDTPEIRQKYVVSYILCQMLRRLTSLVVLCPRTYQKFFWHRTRLRHHHERQRGLSGSRGIQLSHRWCGRT